MNEPTEYEMLKKDIECSIRDIAELKEYYSYNLKNLENDLAEANEKLSYYSHLEP